MATMVSAVTRPDLPPFSMSARFRHEVSYFMGIPGERGVPKLGAGEYWIHRADAERWLEDGVFYLLSPLDTAKQTEIELSEEQQALLEWLVAHGVEHVRLS